MEGWTWKRKVPVQDRRGRWRQGHSLSDIRSISADPFQAHLARPQFPAHIIHRRVGIAAQGAQVRHRLYRHAILTEWICRLLVSFLASKGIFGDAHHGPPGRCGRSIGDDPCPLVVGASQKIRSLPARQSGCCEHHFERDVSSATVEAGQIPETADPAQLGRYGLHPSPDS